MQNTYTKTARRKNMKTYIHFDKMHFYAYHGVDAQEQTVGNNYTIDLLLYVPFEAAMRSDSLANTINYAMIYKEINTVMASPSCLLENVAGRIITILQARFPKIKGGRIALYKDNPPISGNIDRIGVIIEW